MDPENNHSANALMFDSGDDSRHSRLKSELTCSICMELFVKAATLNCSHTFCGQCIDKWREKRKICPICRVKIETASPTNVVDRCVGKVLESASSETKRKRKEMIEQRNLELKTKKRKVTVPLHNPTLDERLFVLMDRLFEYAHSLREAIQNVADPPDDV